MPVRCRIRCRVRCRWWWRWWWRRRAGLGVGVAPLVCPHPYSTFIMLKWSSACIQTHNHTDIQIYMTRDFWLLPRTYRHRHTAHGSEQYTRIHTWMDGWIEGREIGNRGIGWRKTGKYSNGTERKSERTNESTTRLLERSPVAVVTVPVTDAPSTEHRAPSTRLPG